MFRGGVVEVNRKKGLNADEQMRRRCEVRDFAWEVLPEKEFERTIKLGTSEGIPVVRIGRVVGVMLSKGVCPMGARGRR